MKKIIFFILFFMQIGFASEISSHKIKTILRGEDCAILLLDDHSFWKIYSAKEVSRSWSEWWHNIVPVNPDKKYICEFEQWEFFSNVEVSPFTPTREDIEKNHNDEISECTFIIQHQKTNTIAFAKPLEIEEFVFFIGAFQQKMNRLLQEEYDRGYNIGYSIGYTAGAHSHN